MMKYNFPILPPLFLAALLALGSCIPLTHCTDEPPVAPPDTTTPPPPRDTTSHEFTWELHKIGGMYGEMEDVWAIDDDYAIAVGRFTWQDSTGTEVHDSLKNIVELINGSQYKSRAMWSGYKLNTLYSCFARSEDDVWIGTGGPYKRADTGYISYKATDVQRPPWGGLANKMWGSKNSDAVYLTCGPVIQRVKDGQIKTIVVPYGSPGMGFYNIWGEDEGDVMAVGNNGSDGYMYLYLIHPDDTWEIVHKTESFIGGPWGYNGNWYFTEYSAVKIWDGKNVSIMNPSVSKVYDIRGNNENDIFFLCGGGGKVLHWNGSTYEYIYAGEWGSISVYGISVSNNAVYVCGVLQPGQQPVILVGKRKK